MAKPVTAVGWAASDPSGLLSPIKFSRRAASDRDVQLQLQTGDNKLARFDGTNYTRWKDRMVFLLTAHKVFYVLEADLTPISEPTPEESETVKNERGKRKEDELVCRGYILNSLTDRLFDLHRNSSSPKEIWASFGRLPHRPPQHQERVGQRPIPLVPGHEIVGVVTSVGPKAQKFKPGDKVGVGCLIISCRSCDQCASDLENYCTQALGTYNFLLPDGSTTYGGYSDVMVVDEDFVIRWPKNFPMDKGAPLLCAGITTYSALRYYGLDKPGLQLGVVGLGGLGHVAVKFAKAFGTKVTVISTSYAKKKEAMEFLYADAFLLSSDAAEMKEAEGTLDGIIDTVSAQHLLPPLLSLLKAHGKMVVVGAPEKPLELPTYTIVNGRKTVAGSLIGGLKETQEMIDFAAKHNILADVEMIPMDYVNTAMERLAKADVKYRFVIDVGNTL